MPNQRSDGQKLFNFPAKESFIRELDAALAGIGYDNRSRFIRDAIYEKLERLKIKLPPELKLAATRPRRGTISDAPGGEGGTKNLAGKIGREALKSVKKRKAEI